MMDAFLPTNFLYRYSTGKWLMILYSESHSVENVAVSTTCLSTIHAISKVPLDLMSISELSLSLSSYMDATESKAGSAVHAINKAIPPIIKTVNFFISQYKYNSDSTASNSSFGAKTRQLSSGITLWLIISSFLTRYWCFP
ncbi:hypothetical protein SAMN04487902_10436 [Prevotella sp. ne3005]|nr:hypothetical protein SAMN04487902_10436 [Prevotella sp. ne3005]